MNSYAIVATGGKQYKVSRGDFLNVELIKAEPGSVVELDQVLAICQDGQLDLGTPTVEGAKVIAEIADHGKDKKIIVFKFKSKTRYRRKRGHRQGFSRIEIKQILKAAGEPMVSAEVEPVESSSETKLSPAPQRKRRAPAKRKAPVATSKTEAAASAESEVESIQQESATQDSPEQPEESLN